MGVGLGQIFVMHSRGVGNGNGVASGAGLAVGADVGAAVAFGFRETAERVAEGF